MTTGFAQVLTDINTEMATLGYRLDNTPEGSIPASSVADKTWNYLVNDISSSDDVNSIYVNRQIASFVMSIYRHNPKSNENTGYKNCILDQETIIKNLTARSTWTAATTIQITHVNSSFEYLNDSLTKGIINFEIIYNI